MENLQEKKKSLDSEIVDLLIGGFYMHLYPKLSKIQKENKQGAKDETAIRPLTQEEKELRLKVKFFKLTIKTCFFWNKKIWEMRDKPLSDQEVEYFFTSTTNEK